MKTRLHLLVFIGLSITFNTVYGQTCFAKIEKNINVKAKSLSHDLNISSDTLLLKSDRKITQIYSINSEYKREVDLYLDSQSYKLPLKDLSIGKHLFVVGEPYKKIVFVIRIIENSDIASIEKTNVTYSDN